MKEYIVRIPDDSEEIITAIMEKFGVQVTEIKQKKTSAKKPSSKKKRTTPKEKIDHTYLFGKWKDLDIDAGKLREELWRNI